MFEKVKLDKIVSQDTKKDPRVYDWLQKDLGVSDYVIFGYPDDEGIKNNGGRLGASLAPDVIRKFFYKMRPSLFYNFKSPALHDFGNLKMDTDLATRHKQAVIDLDGVLDQGKTVISFGGGHDYGYVDGKSFLNFCAKKTFNPKPKKSKVIKADKKPLIINFDAHFDVRNMDQGITSGTPFYRLLEEEVFEFIEIGIQEQCNTKAHYDYIKSKGGHVLFLNDLLTQGHFDFKKFTDFIISLNIKHTTCYLSVDIDAFSNAFAPGCSQSFATGLTPEPFFLMMNYFIENFDIRSLGIYEVSPTLDFDDITSKLAALIAYKFINFKQNIKCNAN